jgi:HEAT repeat protein
MHAEASDIEPSPPREVRPIAELLALPDSDDLQGQVLDSLRADSNALATIGRHARSGKLQQSVMHALAREGSSEAQRVLSDLIQNQQRPVRERQDALEALAWTEQPNETSLSALDEARTDTEPDIRNAAALAYGTSIHHQQKHDANAAAQRSGQLASQLAIASTPEQAMALLGTLGNIGDSARAEAILALTRSPDPLLRSTAYRALRLIRTREVDLALVRGMTSDPDAAVRESALFAAGMRPVESTFAGIEQVCRTEAVSGLRSDAMSILGTALEQGASGEVVELLDWISEHDPDPELRGRATELLNG